MSAWKLNKKSEMTVTDSDGNPVTTSEPYVHWFYDKAEVWASPGPARVRIPFANAKRAGGNGGSRPSTQLIPFGC